MRYAFIVAAMLVVAVLATGCMQTGKSYEEKKNVRRVEREKLLGRLKDKQDALGYDEGARRIFQFQERALEAFLKAEDLFNAGEYSTAIIRFEEVLEMLNAMSSMGPIEDLEGDTKSYIAQAKKPKKRH
ncbi:MAG: hypothetical protein ACYS8W_06045 [Planctomycetota bacterium]|jgi:hypothetical protein